MTVFERPGVRYGVGIAGAAILAFVAFAFLDGTLRLVVLGMAALDLLVTPQVLRMSVENADDRR